MKKYIILFSFIFSTFSLFTEPVLPNDIGLDTISFTEIRRNHYLNLDNNYRPLTFIDYITDPLIVYAGLWLGLGVSMPIWENDDGQVSFISNSERTFADRVSVEPFAQDRIDYITKPLLDIDGEEVIDEYGHTMMTLNNNVYIKNILEPAFFTYSGMYLMSKGYHPMLVVLQLSLFSFLYEFTMRPLFMDMSFEQLIKNPIAGAFFSIFIDELSTFLLTTPHKGLHALGYILNPFKLLPNAKVRQLFLLDPYTQSVSLETIINF